MNNPARPARIPAVVHLDDPDLPGAWPGCWRSSRGGRCSQRWTAGKRPFANRSTTRSRRQDLERLNQESAQLLNRARAASRLRSSSDGRIGRASGCARTCVRKHGPRPMPSSRTPSARFSSRTARALQQIRAEAVDLSVMIASKIDSAQSEQGRQRTPHRRGAEAQSKVSPLNTARACV